METTNFWFKQTTKDFSQTKFGKIIIKTILSNCLYSAFMILGINLSMAQGTAISGTSDPTCDANAILDLQSTSKGVLVPRMSSDPSSTTGLLYYNTTLNAFKYYNGSTWVTIGTEASVSTNACSSDVTITTAGTWYTGTSVSLGTGTWLILAYITIGKANTTADVAYARIWDGSTAYASGQMHNPGTNPHLSTISLSYVITLSSSKTISIQGTSSVNTALIKAALVNYSQGNNATRITAIKIGL